jgi:hypothetical protein
MSNNAHCSSKADNVAEILRKRDRRTWNEEDNTAVLKYLLDTIRSGRSIEKPNATAYYQRATDKLSLANCTSSQLKNQVKNLRQRYTKAIEWRGKTGQGVLEVEGEDSVRRKLLRNKRVLDYL